MTPQFREDFFWMLREGKGLRPWIAGHPYRLFRHFWKEFPCHRCCEPSGSDLVRLVLESPFLAHELMDMFFKAIVRAETRFISRYVPQRSHEERLTGHLVSEMDNALSLTREHFEAAASKRYGEPKTVDFLYYDLSRGGRIEKHTGADLGLILVVDLPDYPKMVKTVILQAKKLQGSSQLTTAQHDVLLKHGNGAAYLFYDMDVRTLTSPIVVTIEDFDVKRKHEEAVKNLAGSFTVTFEEVMDGMPLSLFLVEELMGEKGMSHTSFANAFRFLTRDINEGNLISLGALGVVSLGKKIQTAID